MTIRQTVSLTSLAAITMLSPAVAHAQSRWVTLARGGSPVIEGDSSSSRRHETHIDIWIRLAYSKPRDLAPAAKNRLLYTNSVERWSVDCNERRYRSFHSVYHNSAGDVVYSTDDEEDAAAWKVVVPETIGEAAVDSVCANDSVFDGTYGKELRAYLERSAQNDSARAAACREKSTPAVIPLCARLRAIRGDSSASLVQRYRLEIQIDSILGSPSPGRWPARKHGS